jgi:tetratricopeptide (TPR) repeat protein
MSSAWKCALPLVLLLGAAPATVAAPPEPTAEQVARWVEQLGDNRFDVRQEASRHLWETGRAAEPALAQAAQSTDVEVRRRANDLLDRFRWGIYPDTPADVVALIGRYQAGDVSAKQAVVGRLLDRGSPGCAALSKVLTAEPSEPVRRSLLLVVAQETPRAFAPLLTAGDLDTLERLLEASLAVPLNEPAVQNYAAFSLLRGRLDDAVRRFRDRVAAGNDPAARTVLTYLHRARGDLTAARAAAEKSGRDDLLDQVLIEQGDWKELARRADAREKTSDLRLLGFRMTYHRLAGDAAWMDKAAAELRAQTGTPGEDLVPWLGARILLLNGRPDDALAVLQVRRARTVFEVLAARMQLSEALALPDRSPANDPEGPTMLAIAKARLRYLLGDRDAAREAFTRIGAGIAQGRGGKAYELLVRTEARLGLTEQALGHAARLLAGSQTEGTQEELLGLVFPRRGDRAAVWWRFLRQRSREVDPAATLARVRDLVEGKTTGKELEALAEEAIGAAPRDQGPDRAAWLLAVAETCRDAGLDATARDAFEKAAEAGTPAALLGLGDFLAGHRLWAEAAARYGRAWENDRRDPLPLFLQGWALTQAGDRAGARLTDLAHWAPLGDEAVRQRFAAELHRRGHDEAARRERRLLLAVCGPLSFPAGEALRDDSMEAMARKDFLKAADEQERALLRLLEPDVEFVEGSAYVTVPAFIHRLRALGQASAGRADEAVQEARAALELLPGNVELASGLVPALDRLGRKKEADDLFARALAVQRKRCDDYPRAAWLHNNLAWMSACCRRDLDAALEQARRAVELDPAGTGYLDTLAEVHFQRGERDQAIAAMKRCLERQPGEAYYRKQLKRFEAGDRSAEVPSRE